MRTSQLWLSEDSFSFGEGLWPRKDLDSFCKAQILPSLPQENSFLLGKKINLGIERRACHALQDRYSCPLFKDHAAGAIAEDRALKSFSLQPQWMHMHLHIPSCLSWPMEVPGGDSAQGFEG